MNPVIIFTVNNNSSDLKEQFVFISYNCIDTNFVTYGIYVNETGISLRAKFLIEYLIFFQEPVAVLETNSLKKPHVDVPVSFFEGIQLQLSHSILTTPFGNNNLCFLIIVGLTQVLLHL